MQDTGQAASSHSPLVIKIISQRPDLVDQFFAHHRLPLRELIGLAQTFGLGVDECREGEEWEDAEESGEEHGWMLWVWFEGSLIGRRRDQDQGVVSSGGVEAMIWSARGRGWLCRRCCYVRCEQGGRSKLVGRHQQPSTSTPR